MFGLFRLPISMRLVRLVAILVVTITIWALILRTRGFDIEVVSVHVAQQTTEWSLSCAMFLAIMCKALR